MEESKFEWKNLGPVFKEIVKLEAGEPNDVWPDSSPHQLEAIYPNINGGH